MKFTYFMLQSLPGGDGRNPALQNLLLPHGLFLPHGLLLSHGFLLPETGEDIEVLHPEGGQPSTALQGPVVVVVPVRAR